MKMKDLVFVGFNAQVAALDQQTGEIVWQWQAASGSGFVSLLLDGTNLFAAIQGYTYCLDARTGQQLWLNPMKGFGFGVTSLVSTQGSSLQAVLGEAAAAAARASAAAAGGSAGAAS